MSTCLWFVEFSDHFVPRLVCIFELASTYDIFENACWARQLSNFIIASMVIYTWKMFCDPLPAFIRFVFLSSCHNDQSETHVS